MEHHRTPKRLARGEYLKTGHRGNDQTAGARRVFISIVQRVVPEFFGQLRERVYPRYLRYARVADRTPPVTSRGLRQGPGYWETGWRFETWEAHSGSNRFKPLLLSWATDFGSSKETWVLEGALETLSAWYRHPDIFPARDVSRFCLPVAGKVLVDYEMFSFEDAGWNPQFETWASYRTRVQGRFKTELQTYERKVRKLVESQGGERARRRHSVKNFEWFALYQLCGMSSVQIENARGAETGDESTVLKGIKTAAQLLDWHSLRSVPSSQSEA